MALAIAQVSTGVASASRVEMTTKIFPFMRRHNDSLALRYQPTGLSGPSIKLGRSESLSSGLLQTFKRASLRLTHCDGHKHPTSETNSRVDEECTRRSE